MAISMDVIQHFRAADLAAVEKDAVLLDITRFIERVAGVEDGLMVLLIQLAEIKVELIHDLGVHDLVNIGSIGHFHCYPVAFLRIGKTLEIHAGVAGNERCGGKAGETAVVVETGAFQRSPSVVP